MEPMTSVWKDPTKYKDYDKLWPLVSMAKKIVVDNDGYPINIEKINDQYKGFYLRKDRSENPIKWNAITVYQRLPDFQFIADKIDQRYTLLKNEFEKIETVTQAVINYIGPQSITPLHSDSKTYKGSGQDYVGGVMANGVVAPTYQIMIGLWKNEVMAIMMTFILVKSTGKIFKCIGNLIILRAGIRMDQEDSAKMKKFKIWLNKVRGVSQLVPPDKSMKLTMIKK
jgi:hypothetical protein